MELGTGTAGSAEDLGAGALAGSWRRVPRCDSCGGREPHRGCGHDRGQRSTQVLGEPGARRARHGADGSHWDRPLWDRPGPPVGKGRSPAIGCSAGRS